VAGAASEQDAETLAKSVIDSSLVKAALFGADANWGRVLCALGYAGVGFNPDACRVSFISDAGKVTLFDKGAPLPFSEDEAKKVLLRPEVEILVELDGSAPAVSAWGCDLTYDYVKINGDYRT
jgi:glutamate N-acetyltransferase/amino-acid N-acetyltransferase